MKDEIRLDEAYVTHDPNFYKVSLLLLVKGFFLACMYVYVRNPLPPFVRSFVLFPSLSFLTTSGYSSVKDYVCYVKKMRAQSECRLMLPNAPVITNTL
ncbi:hypothetical protein F5Y10DRAFT_168949 [Nemania abortiva]|nr:hypothetical protein F5Y10DRAFT_168949 [Nemania abortiva]